MKRRYAFFWIIAVVATLVVLFLWLKKTQPTETPSASIETQNQPAVNNNSVRINPPVVQDATGTNTPTPPLESKEKQMREGLAQLNDEAIEFYGRAMDQFGSPVAEASVAGSIQVNNGSRVGADKISLVTDGNGVFTVNGHKGEALGIWITKEGYVMAATNTHFIYSFLWPASQRFTPDPNNPTVIRMWKRQGAEPLVDISKEYKLPFTSAPIYFDLVAGNIVPTGGDVKITVNRPSGEVSEHNPQDWGFEIEAVGGGLIETSGQEEAVAFAAPENGYEPTKTLSASSNRQGIGGIQQGFFLESRNGQVYSKFGILFGINKKPDDLMYVRITGVANTNGSRNWEATVPR